jgi:ligand-binding SRPBCC domain-containing protein
MGKRASHKGTQILRPPQQLCNWHTSPGILQSLFSLQVVTPLQDPLSAKQRTENPPEFAATFAQ